MGIPMEKLSLSNGWLHKFKARHNVRPHTLDGGSDGSVTCSEPVVDPIQLQHLLSEYSPEDAFNLDETALLYRLPPKKALLIAVRRNGKNDASDRITVALCCNLTGSEKMAPMIVGRTKCARPDQTTFYYSAFLWIITGYILWHGDLMRILSLWTWPATKGANMASSMAMGRTFASSRRSTELRGARSGLTRSTSTASNGSSASATDAAAGSRRQTSTELQNFSLENDDDFEKLLASYDVPNAIDALRRYLALEVQSNVLGVAASKQQSAQIKRTFYERFNQILDRLFGNDPTSKHKYGGWLDYSLGLAPVGGSTALPPRKKRAPTSAQGPLSPEQEEEARMDAYIDSLTASGRALVDFLGFHRDDEAGSIFQFLFKMTHPVEFKLEMDMLPEQSKMSIMSRSAFTSVLFTQLLQKPTLKQRIDPRNPVLLVSIKELYLFYFMRHPASATHQTSPGTSETASTGSSSLMGSISDTFGRPKRRADYSWRSFFTEGVGSLTKGNPYNVLLLQYLNVFFPDSKKPVQSRFHGKILQFSNLFLHILIEFWLRQNLIVFSDDPTSATSSVDLYRVQQRLASPFANVHTQTTYMAPSDDLLSSLLLTITHLLSDSFYPAPIGMSTSSASGYSSAVMVGSGGGYLSPSISVVRRPLYEFLRLVFSRSPIGLSSTAFCAITDVWLAYIQPWNCQSWSQGQATKLRRSTSDNASNGNASDSNSNGNATSNGYTAAWETYVLANYHFYTTLLGAFVERAKELDFTGSDDRPLVMLDRVLSVFTPDLLSLLRHASDFLDASQPYSFPSTTAMRGKTAKEREASLSPAQGQVLTYYCKALGLECVGVPIHASYHRDAERLFDKLWNDSGVTGAENSVQPSTTSSTSSTSWFGPSGETPFERTHRLSRHLRRVFEISDAYVASTAHSRSLQSASNGWEPLEPSREATRTHLLTREGIFQLRNGMRLCSPEEMRFIGDPMLRPICSYEIPMLVRLSYRVSTWLNQQLGLHNPYHGKHFEDNAQVDPTSGYARFRINLRFLASKPNLAFLTAFLWLVYLILLW
ncbi:hypothetical protein Poli38472_002153 [Pythium oligandrum]|uniref:HTH CENPB-type domain-containing protein n=1 Tax=Pythium oligandrum TaxID=41045 RepID=A0A8K1FKV3_PYTOL|nr:hypothetical protein Poli38472_002153 [Pythium oligandrum]|eukprot:TMW63212.1 hypothetical protein Poli38472_002153 [Pythium oligandrum]